MEWHTTEMFKSIESENREKIFFFSSHMASLHGFYYCIFMIALCMVCSKCTLAQQVQDRLTHTHYPRQETRVKKTVIWFLFQN